MEERLEEANIAGPLASPHNWHDMESLVVWCRAAAALQPDGTGVPSTRCEVRMHQHAIIADGCFQTFSCHHELSAVQYTSG